MKKIVLFFNLAIMIFFIGWGLLAPDSLLALMRRPELYLHIKFIHIFCVTLVFAMALIGTFWETMALLSAQVSVMRFTFNSLVRINAFFTSPLIIMGALSGIMLGTLRNGVWSQGWLSLAFILFVLTGVIWVITDLPMQLRYEKLFASIDQNSMIPPDKLKKLFWHRTWVNCFGTGLILVIFYLMVHKPEIPQISNWFPQVQQQVAKAYKLYLR